MSDAPYQELAAAPPAASSPPHHHHKGEQHATAPAGGGGHGRQDVLREARPGPARKVKPARRSRSPAKTDATSALTASLLPGAKLIKP